MRIHFRSSKSQTDEQYTPIVKWVGQQFNAPGAYEVTIFAPYKYLVGWRSGCRYISLSGFDNQVNDPPTQVKHTYYRGYKYEVAPYELRSSKEHFVHNLAFGLAAASMGRSFRPSTRRILATNKATEILNAFRQPEAQEWLEAYDKTQEKRKQAEQDRNDAKWAQAAQKKILKDAPETKIAALKTRRLRWQRKFNRAQAALRNIDRQIKRLQK